jgi:murein hydrolase activator
LRRSGGAAALIAAALALAAAAQPFGLARAGEKEDLEALRKRVERLRGDLAGAEGSRSEAADQLRESERATSEANRTLRDLAA